ncbi:MAG: hypothetical protein R2857_04520 [Vampirovibrionales bacterium]
MEYSSSILVSAYSFRATGSLMASMFCWIFITRALAKFAFANFALCELALHFDHVDSFNFVLLLTLLKFKFRFLEAEFTNLGSQSALPSLGRRHCFELPRPEFINGCKRAIELNLSLRGSQECSASTILKINLGGTVNREYTIVGLLGSGRGGRGGRGGRRRTGRGSRTGYSSHTSHISKIIGAGRRAVV